MKRILVLIVLVFFAPGSFGGERAKTVDESLGATIIDLISHAKQVDIYHRDTRKFKHMGPDFYERQLEQGPVLKGHELDALREILLSNGEYDWVHRAECKINPDFVLHFANDSAYVEVWVCLSCGLTNFFARAREDGKHLGGATLQSGSLHHKFAELMNAYFPGDPILSEFKKSKVEDVKKE